MHEKSDLEVWQKSKKIKIKGISIDLIVRCWENRFGPDWEREEVKILSKNNKEQRSESFTPLFRSLYGVYCSICFSDWTTLN